MELLERDIARTASDLLIADGWRMLITDPVSNRALGKGFGEIGMADRLYIRYSFDRRPPDGQWNETLLRAVAVEVLWIEWKRTVHGKATKPTLAQTAWHTLERKRGALTLIAGEDFEASIEGFQDWYKSSGLMRKVR